MKQIRAIARKELEAFFGSPMALIFVGAYLAVTLFAFFWADAFFSRGVADVRPLFRWTPVLLGFLVAAMTMRQWSEEARAGTLEVLLTLPVSSVQLAVAKFLAVMAEVLVALALTLFLPLTVSLLGPLDWGPVIGGYLAALLLAAAYAAVGLFVSSRTDNQIVALIATVLGCGALYLAGSAAVTGWMGEGAARILRAIGTGSRFESIQRGVIDLRDLVYYLSLTAAFLGLNVLSLEAKRWSRGVASRPPRAAGRWLMALMAVNLLVLNVWLYPLRGLRVDLTAQHEYTLSRATRTLLAQLREPLLIRAYLSEKTHPLLAPLTTRIADMLEEYRVAGGDRVQVEILDPATDPDKENEANQVYGIQPTPFQVAGRYETSIINSYFDILVRYGDQNTTLSFRDLIELTSRRDGTMDVGLRNLEYDLTSAIKKTAYGFQSPEAVLAGLSEPARLMLVITPDTLPQALATTPDTMRAAADKLAAASSGKLTVSVVNPDASGAQVTRQALLDQYGIQPLLASLFSDQTFYMHMVLEAGGSPQIIYPSEDVSEAGIRGIIEAALRRAAPGFLQVVGLWTPPDAAQTVGMQQTGQTLSSWQELGNSLRQEYEVRALDLNTPVPADVDVLVLVAPQGLSDAQRYAVDQFLMRGGAIIAAAGNYCVASDQYTGGLALQPLTDGIGALLASYGITVEQKLVLDPQNEPFPVTVARQSGGMQFQELQAMNYPFFVDIRSDGMAQGNAIVSNLPAVTLNWASPITLDETKNAGRQVTTVLQSTAQSWTQSDYNIQPDMQTYPGVGFPTGQDLGRKPLAVAVQGSFESAFKGQEPPLPAGQALATAQWAPIERSSEGARLLVIGSAEFVDDLVFNISSQMTMDRYLNSLKLVQNAVAWATEDADLLEIRARGAYTRILNPMSEAGQRFWEVANYALALAALLGMAALWRARRKKRVAMALLTPEQVAQMDQEESR